MGAEPWFIIVPHQEDVEAALQEARAKVFRERTYVLTGRKKPRTIEEALERGGEDGTNSVLDMTHVAKRATDGAVAPLTKRSLLKLFGTEQPTEKLWWENFIAVWDWMERGRGIYLVLHKDGKPDKLLFAGLSWD